MDGHDPFSLLPPAEPPAGLDERVIAAFRRAALRRAWSRRASGLILLVASCVAALPAVRFLGTEASHSGFFSYVSLAFSDGGAVIALWRDFGATLVESFPVLGAAAVLATVLGALFAIRSIVLAGAGRSAAPRLGY